MQNIYKNKFFNKSSFFLKKITGLTLLELLISITLLSLLSLMVVRIIKITLKAWNDSEKQSQYYYNIMKSIEIIKKDIRNIFVIRDKNISSFILDYDVNKLPRIRFIKRDKFLKEIAYFLVEKDKNIYELFKIEKEYKIGDKYSIFINSNLQNFKLIKKIYKNKLYKVLTNILYLEMRCWTYNSKGWFLGKNGTLREWLSSKNEYIPIKLRFKFFMKTPFTPIGILENDISSDINEIKIEYIINYSEKYIFDSSHIVFVDKEAIFYESMKDNILKGVKRGYLMTSISSHEKESNLYWSKIFDFIVYLPISN